MNRPWHSALLALIVLTACAPVAGAAGIVVVKSQALSAYDTAQQGFMSVVGGQVGGRVVSYTLSEEASAGRIVSQIKAGAPDVVLVLGTEAARQVGAALGGIPVVFAMVVDPVQSGVVSNLARPGGNMTGVMLAVPPLESLQALKRAVPKARRVGVIYDPAQSQRAVREMTEAARALGLQVVSRAVRSGGEVPRAAEELHDGIDALYAPVDGTVYSAQSAKFLLLFALRSGIPVIGFSTNLVQAGALLAVYPDYTDIGRQAGYIALRILSGEAPGGIAVAAPRKVLLAINLSVERTLGLTIPQSVRKTADKIYK